MYTCRVFPLALVVWAREHSTRPDHFLVFLANEANGFPGDTESCCCLVFEPVHARGVEMNGETAGASLGCMYPDCSVVFFTDLVPECYQIIPGMFLNHSGRVLDAWRHSFSEQKSP